MLCSDPCELLPSPLNASGQKSLESQGSPPLFPFSQGLKNCDDYSPRSENSSLDVFSMLFSNCFKWYGRQNTVL